MQHFNITRYFFFDSAHFLPNVPEGHRCKNMHGHTYKLEVTLRGTLDANLGWVQDFDEVKQVVAPLIDLVDHKILNNVEGIKHSTAEELCFWFWSRIKPLLPQLSRIAVWETQTSYAEFNGD